MNALIEELKNNNLKVTQQRLVIYDYLKKNYNHPSAETIYNNIRQDNPTISLATVYKTLKSLKDAKLIQEINVGEDSFRYDATLSPHFHIICKKCSHIHDYFPKPAFSKNIKEKIQNTTNFKIDSEQIYFYGVCEKCSKDT